MEILLREYRVVEEDCRNFSIETVFPEFRVTRGFDVFQPCGLKIALGLRFL